MPQSGTSNRTQSGTQRSQPQSANQQGGQQDKEPTQSSQVSWFATTAVRTGVIVIGFILLLFALEQAVGANLLGMVADALSS